MLLYSGSSIPGQLSDHHKGYIHADQERGIFVIVQETGDHSACEQAIPDALRILTARLERETGSTEERIREAITLANNEIYSLSQRQDKECAATFSLAVLLIEEREAIAGHVGDIQLFKIKPDSINKIAPVYASTGTQEPSDGLTPTDTEQHSLHTELTRSVGLKEHDPDDADFIDLIRIPFDRDSALLLCNNSLSKVLSPADMLFIVKRHPGNRARVVRDLIIMADQASGRESLSVLFIEGARLARELRRYRLHSQNLM